MSDPRQHHIISKTLHLRRFTDGDGRLFAYDKRQSERGIFASSPHSAFKERDLNSIRLPDGTRDSTLETSYSQLEGQLAPIIEKIVCRAETGKPPGLSQIEKNAWDNYVYHQQKRAPDAYDRLGRLSDFPTNLAAYFNQFEQQHRPLTEIEKTELQKAEVQERIIKNAQVHARSKGSDEVISALANRGLAIAVVRDARKSFIIGDHPIVRMGLPNHQHLADPALELWFPISAYVAVSPWGIAGSERLVSFEVEHVRKLNRTVFNQSNVIAGRSKQLIQSLAGVQ